MKICVVGWYFYPKIYQVLAEIHKKYPVFIVANRNYKTLNKCSLPYYVRENTGIDFGAYSYYLDNVWDDESSVLFMHDDVIIRDIKTIDEIAATPHDHIYIFRDQDEYDRNRGCQGRVFYCSAKTLKLLRKQKGIWFDRENRGNTTIAFPERNGLTGMHYNEAICRFRSQMHVFKVDHHLDTEVRMIIPTISPARRGKWHE